MYKVVEFMPKRNSIEKKKKKKKETKEQKELKKKKIIIKRKIQISRKISFFFFFLNDFGLSIYYRPLVFFCTGH